MPNGFVYLNSSDRSIAYRSSVQLVLLLPCFTKNSLPKFNANCVDLDQTPRSAASDLGLLCLPMSLLWDALKSIIIMSFESGKRCDVTQFERAI